MSGLVDTVIIGNGPSAISLSYILSGWTPYLKQKALCGDELLQAKLDYCFEHGGSLLDKNFDLLTSGLEGRSSNPVALLFDKLVKPQADLNIKRKSLLEWRREKERAVDHIVIGKGIPGGAWQLMPKQMETLSAAAWLELPDAPFADWLANHSAEEIPQLSSNSVGARPTASLVQRYFTDYVREKSLKERFVNNTIIISVKRCPPSMTHEGSADTSASEGYDWEVVGCCLDDPEDAGITCDDGCCDEGCYGNGCHRIRWHLSHFRSGCEDDQGNESGCHSDCSSCCDDDRRCMAGWRCVSWRARNVVLACGTFDTPNTLHVPGEQLPFVRHATAVTLDTALAEADEQANSARPVLVIGAGLTAADAILDALERGVPVTHVFSRAASDPSIIYGRLPTPVYPRYHALLAMMKGETTHPCYTPMERHRVLEILQSKQVVVAPSSDIDACSVAPDDLVSTKASSYEAKGKDTTRQSHENLATSTTAKDTIEGHYTEDNRSPTRCQHQRTVDVSLVYTCIGSHSDLSFLHGAEMSLGCRQGELVNCKTNPMAIEPLTHEVSRQPSLYALGPLVGDNFVRFIQGGALAAAKHLQHKMSGR